MMAFHGKNRILLILKCVTSTWDSMLLDVTANSTNTKIIDFMEYLTILEHWKEVITLLTVFLKSMINGSSMMIQKFMKWMPVMSNLLQPTFCHETHCNEFIDHVF